MSIWKPYIFFFFLSSPYVYPHVLVEGEIQITEHVTVIGSSSTGGLSGIPTTPTPPGGSSGGGVGEGGGGGGGGTGTSTSACSPVANARIILGPATMLPGSSAYVPANSPNQVTLSTSSTKNAVADNEITVDPQWENYEDTTPWMRMNIRRNGALDQVGNGEFYQVSSLHAVFQAGNNNSFPVPLEFYTDGHLVCNNESVKSWVSERIQLTVYPNNFTSKTATPLGRIQVNSTFAGFKDCFISEFSTNFSWSETASLERSFGLEAQTDVLAITQDFNIGESLTATVSAGKIWQVDAALMFDVLFVTGYTRYNLKKSKVDWLGVPYIAEEYDINYPYAAIKARNPESCYN